jgi:hypothetical protein
VRTVEAREDLSVPAWGFLGRAVSGLMRMSFIAAAPQTPPPRAAVFVSQRQCGRGAAPRPATDLAWGRLRFGGTPSPCERRTGVAVRHEAVAALPSTGAVTNGNWC